MKSIKFQFRVITLGLWGLQWLFLGTAILSLTKYFLDGGFSFAVLGFLFLAGMFFSFHGGVLYRRSFGQEIDNWFLDNVWSKLNRRTKRKIIRKLKSKKTK